MKRITYLFALLVAASQWGVAVDPGWPRLLTNTGGKLLVYQPQVDSWESFRDLNARMAISLTAPGEKAVVGVLSVHADTVISNDDDTVVLTNIAVTKSYFPSLDEVAGPSMGALAATFLPQTVTMSLRKLVASVPANNSHPGVPVKNDPPLIFVSYQPAMLLQLDGEPARAPIQGTKLEIIYNTGWRLFFNKSDGQYYLLGNKQWMKAKDLSGPWATTTKLPGDFTKLLKQAGFSDLKPMIPPPASAPAAPKVFYATTPAELITFQGAPTYKGIVGTGLTYATNASTRIFQFPMTGTFYYPTAGRWFSASTLDGPWVYATPDLPPDFANLPPYGPFGDLLSTVPGTFEAKDAVLLAQIPTIVTVNPTTAAAKVKVTYAGEPQFVPIEGTSMSYANNTQDKVIQVGSLYYLCFQGIWFMSTTAQGPWQTATSVPQEIYTIPPSSPVYNVTYVTQSSMSDGNIQASYTAGYMGAFVVGTAVGAVIACGSGYYYPPYMYYGGFGYPYYYPRPYTYGAVPYYNTVSGAYGYRGGAYGPYGGASWGASYNPNTGTYARGATASTAYGSRSVGQAYNPYTGAYGATRQGSNAYSSWGSSVVSKNGQTAYTQHYSNARGSVGTAEGSNGGRAVAGSSAYGSGFAGKSSSGDMYAGHDGNVYKNTGSGWQKYDNGGWNDVNKPTGSQSFSQAASRENAASSGSFQRPSGSSDQLQGLNQQAQDRQRGEFQSGDFNQARSGGGGWGGGGGESRWGSGGGGGRWGDGGGGGRWGGGGGFGGGRFGGGRR